MGLFDYILKGAETGFSLLSSANQADYADKSGEYNAQVAEINAERARKEADLIRRQTELRIDSVRRIASQTEGSQRAMYGASGVQAGSGSAVDVYKDTATQAALDVEIIRMEGDTKVIATEQKAQDYMNEADLSRWEGDQRSNASWLGFGASLLKGGADTYNMWKKGQ
jgi:hypothetical protein